MLVLKFVSKANPILILTVRVPLTQISFKDWLSALLLLKHFAIIAVAPAACPVFLQVITSAMTLAINLFI